MIKQHRFTVYTQDAKHEIRYGGVENRKREFVIEYGFYRRTKWKKKMAIESIHCRDLDQLLVDNNFIDQDYDIDAMETINATRANYYNQIATAIGNTDEKELYSIRCRNINSGCCGASRPSAYGGTPLICNGSLNFYITNPEKPFCFDVDGNIANSEFTLMIEDNYFNFVNNTYVDTLGIKESLEIEITFILYVDSDDNKK